MVSMPAAPTSDADTSVMVDNAVMVLILAHQIAHERIQPASHATAAGHGRGAYSGPAARSLRILLRRRRVAFHASLSPHGQPSPILCDSPAIVATIG